MPFESTPAHKLDEITQRFHWDPCFFLAMFVGAVQEGCKITDGTLAAFQPVVVTVLFGAERSFCGFRKRFLIFRFLDFLCLFSPFVNQPTDVEDVARASQNNNNC